MTRGRKKEPLAVRDGRDPAGELARVEAATVDPDARARKPAEVAGDPALSLMWDELVGDGSAYREQDVPLLVSWVWWTEAANQLRARMTAPDGTISTMAQAWQGDNLVEVETPFLKQYERATNMSLKLAEHFGGTPMARARLGLTRAATASIGEDIRAKVIAAMHEAGR